MTFWEAKKEAIASGKSPYIIYAIVNDIRYSYVNQFDAAYEFMKKQLLQTKKQMRATNYWKLTDQEIAIIKNKLSQKNVLYYQKERLGKNNGWSCFSKTTEPDDEMCHVIITAEWECVYE